MDSNDEIAQLQRSAHCCKTIAEASFAPLPPSQDSSVTVSSSDPVFEFSSGPSHFKAHALPPSASGASRRFYVRSPEPLISAMFGSRVPLHYFIPTVEFLSDDKEPLSEPLDDSLDGCEYSACRGLLLSVAVPANARFAVVYTPTSMLGGARSDEYVRANGITVPLGKGLLTIPGGNSPRVSIGSSTGELRVWLI